MMGLVIMRQVMKDIISEMKFLTVRNSEIKREEPSPLQFKTR